MNKVLVAKDSGPELLSRRWLSLPNTPSLEYPKKSRYQRVKIMTWNLLAQCLIKRELFPTSDCLKASQREPMIHAEILQQGADIICLQEVDRLDKLVPMLENAGYAHHYSSGPGKKHGCMIAFKKNLYSMVSDRVIYYDQYVPADNSGRSQTGNTFKTRNIGLLVAFKLRSPNQESEGLIVATTHLFWHPKYTYERTRQAAILLQEVVAFRTDQMAQKWPCILAGDFNFTPSDPAYTLTVGDTLLPEQEAMISSSFVIHSSVDPSVGVNTPAPSSNADSEDIDPDRVITNARPAELHDELLTISQFIAWFSSLPNLRSAYNDGLQELSKLADTLPTYGRRVTLPLGRRGLHEPAYTSYTHYWQSVIDYVFILDLKEPIDILGLLEPHSAENLIPGLPKKNISGSDHIPLVVELGWRSEFDETLS